MYHGGIGDSQLFPADDFRSAGRLEGGGQQEKYKIIMTQFVMMLCYNRSDRP
jgi:hypothetical protein